MKVMVLDHHTCGLVEVALGEGRDGGADLALHQTAHEQHPAPYGVQFIVVLLGGVILGPGDAKTLLLTAGDAHAVLGEFVLHFLPEGGLAQGPFDPIALSAPRSDSLTRIWAVISCWSGVLIMSEPDII